MAFGQTNAVLHHDLNTSTLMNRYRAGQRVSPAEMRQLTNALANENETRRTGGSVDNPFQREIDPSAAYAAGVRTVAGVVQRPTQTPQATPTTPVSRAFQPPPSTNQRADQMLRGQFGDPAAGGGSFWRNNGDGTYSEGRLNGEQVTRPLSPQVPGSVATPNPSLSGGVGTSSIGEITHDTQPIPNRPNAAAPITPPQREENNPLTGTAPSIPQGGERDISVGKPVTGLTTPTARTVSPAGNFGGFGQYRQQFQTPNSARIYDNYVRSLFSQQPGAATPDRVTPTPLTRAPKPPLSDVSNGELVNRFIGTAQTPPEPFGVMAEAGKRFVKNPRAIWNNTKPQDYQRETQ